MYNVNMDKEKEDMMSIQFWLHKSLKVKLERYCKGKGLTMAEELRCHVLNLSDDGESVDVETELSAMIARLTKKRDALRQQRHGNEPSGDDGQNREAGT